MSPNGGDPPIGARTFADLADSDFDTLANDVGRGYFTAKQFIDRIEDRISQDSVDNLVNEDIHFVGLEFEVGTADGDAPFEDLSGTIGLSIMWFPPDNFGPAGGGNAGPAGPAEIRAFARHDKDGPEVFVSEQPDANLDPDKVDTNAVLYVGHYQEDVADVGFEDCYEVFEVNTVDTTDDSAILLDTDWYGDTLPSDGDGGDDGDPGPWYCFGGTLSVTGDEDAQSVDYSALYENFKWLLWQLLLSAAGSTEDDDVTHTLLTNPRERFSRPAWSTPLVTSGTPLGTSGSFGMGSDCREYDPVAEDTMVIDKLEFDLTDNLGPTLGTVTNWRDDQNIYHFTVPNPPNCRAAGDCTQFVLHETDNPPSWGDHDDWENHQNNTDDNGIHLSIRDDGTVQVHNDVVDRQRQATGLNDTSFGVEICNPAQSWQGTGIAEDRKIENVSYVGGTYARPSEEQLESAAYLAEWFSTAERNRLDVDDTFIGLVEGVQDSSDTQRDGFCIDANLTEPDDNHASPSDSGIWAHSYHTSGVKIDGLFPGLYAWLRLEGNGGMSAQDALDTAEELVNSGNGNTFSDGSKTYVDVGQYTS
jgi:hypothetical protein